MGCHKVFFPPRDHEFCQHRQQHTADRHKRKVPQHRYKVGMDRSVRLGQHHPGCRGRQPSPQTMHGGTSCAAVPRRRQTTTHTAPTSSASSSSCHAVTLTGPSCKSGSVLSRKYCVSTCGTFTSRTAPSVRLTRSVTARVMFCQASAALPKQSHSCANQSASAAVTPPSAETPPRRCGPARPARRAGRAAQNTPWLPRSRAGSHTGSKML